MSVLKKKYFLLGLIILLGLILRVKLSCDDYLHKWDERYHALVAKNMMHHPLKPTLYEDTLLRYDYKLWYGNHIWLHKQPVPLWLISSSYRIFGVTEFYTRLPSMILSIIGIYIIFLLGKALFDDNAGILAAFFFSVNGLIIEIGSGRVATDHYDLIFLVFVEMAVFFALKNSLTNKLFFSFLSGLFVGLALLTKWLPALIVLPVHICFLLQYNSKTGSLIKSISVSVVTCVLVAMPWQLFIFSHYPQEAGWESHFNWLHITSELDGQAGNVFYYLDKIRINYSEIIYIPLAYLLFKLHQSRYRDFRLMALALWIFIPIIFFSIAKTKMQGYILFISPALFIVTGWFFMELKNNLIFRTSNNGFKTLKYLLLALIIALPLRYCYERTKFGFGSGSSNEYPYAYKKFAGELDSKCVVFNVPEPIEFMFYNNCIAYSASSVSSEEKEHILRKGYRTFILNQDKIQGY